MSTLAATNLKHESSASNNIVLDASGNTTIGGNISVTGTTSVGGIPVVTTTGTQTLTNKTLTSPTITGALVSAMASSVITSGTAVASTSGTSIDFTGIPSWAKRVTVMFNGVSTNGTSNVRVRIGPSGGVETSGYLGASITCLTTGVNTQAFTAGFDFYDGGAAAAVRNGVMILALLASSTNTWTASANLGQSDVARFIGLGGSKPLAGALSIVRITTVNGTDTFDAGNINVLYE